VKFKLEESLGYLVRTVTRALRARFNENLVKAGHEINFDEWSIIVTLWENDGQSQQYLGCVTLRDKASIKRLIDNLENRNLVLRIPDKTDRRQKLIYLTPGGKRLYQKLMPVVKETLTGAEQGIEPEHLATCREVLGKIIRNLTE
jgi:DNA-binding MarR family transcriptional regulator